jgi:hypothetical protein
LWNLADSAKSEETLPPAKMAEGKKVQQGTNSAANYHFFYYLQMQPTWKQHFWINLGEAWL